MEKRRKETYQRGVLKKYLLEKEGELSAYFFEPTPGLIKEACMILFDKRRNSEDIKILRNFFKPKGDENIASSIEKIDIDKFRPIVKFLKEGSTSPKFSSLELASWLVDFNPRPFLSYLQCNGEERKVITDNNNGNYQNSEKEDLEKKIQIEKEKRLEEIKKEKKKKKRRWIITISISVAFGATLMTTPFIKNLIFNNPELCMTWVNTHFEEAPCSTSFNAKIAPLDQVRLDTFKKVNVTMATPFFFEETNKPRIWYYKTKSGEIEYYTAPGLHPINGATLLKITPYIIQKYVPLHSNNEESFVK